MEHINMNGIWNQCFKTWEATNIDKIWIEMLFITREFFLLECAFPQI